MRLSALYSVSSSPIYDILASTGIRSRLALQDTEVHFIIVNVSINIVAHLNLASIAVSASLAFWKLCIIWPWRCLVINILSLHFGVDRLASSYIYLN